MENQEHAKSGAKSDTRKKPYNLQNLWLSFLFFATGLVLLLTAMAVSVTALPGLVRETLRAQQGLLLAHLLLPGFATMVAMGASFQITQVILNARLFSRTLGFIQYGLCLSGLLLLLAGFVTEPTWIAFGGGCITLGGLLYAFNLVATWVRQKAWNLFTFGVGLSLLALLANLSLGTAMGIGWRQGWSAERQEALFYDHLWFGVGGWLAGLILVYSFKLLPMFYVSRKKWNASSFGIVGLFHCGIWLQALAPWTGARWVSVLADLLLLAAWGWFIVHIRDIPKLSRGRQPVGAVRVAYALLPMVGGGFLVRCVLQWAGLGSARLDETLVAGIVLGWFAPSILGYLSKILPFLWWAHRFHGKWAKKQVVSLADMLPERRLTRELCGYLGGVAVMLAGYGGNVPFVAAAGQAVALAFTLVFLAELTRVFRY